MVKQFSEGEAILVLGAAGGIGSAVASYAAREGARLYLVDLGTALDGSGRDPRKVAEVAGNLRGLGVEVHAEALDLRDPQAVVAAIHHCVDAFGRVDAIIQCAGIHQESPVQRLDAALVERTLDLSIRLALRLIQEGSRVFIESKRTGSITLSLGAEAFVGAARKAHLAVASGALYGLIRSAAIDLRRWSVRINGVVPTARTRANEDHPLFRSIHPGSLQPESVAPLYLYLASSLASEISGEVLGIAGERIHAFGSRESPGVRFEPNTMSIREIARRFNEIADF